MFQQIHRFTMPRYLELSPQITYYPTNIQHKHVPQILLTGLPPIHEYASSNRIHCVKSPCAWFITGNSGL
jgi:hypothetical protein